MDRQTNAKRKDSGTLDVFAVVVGATAVSIHVFLLLSALSRQIESGWTFGQTVGSDTVMLWIAQAATLPFLLFCIIYSIVRFVGKKKGKTVFPLVVIGTVLLSFLCWGGSLLILFL